MGFWGGGSNWPPPSVSWFSSTPAGIRLKALNIPFKKVVLPGRVKCSGTEGEIVVAHGCRKRKKLICGRTGEIVVAHGRLPSPTRSTTCFLPVQLFSSCSPHPPPYTRSNPHLNTQLIGNLRTSSKNFIGCLNIGSAIHNIGFPPHQKKISSQDVLRTF